MSSIYFLGILLLFLSTFTCTEIKWEVKFENETCSIPMGDSKNVSVIITHLNKTDLIASNATIRIVSDRKILHVSKIIPIDEIEGDKWSGFFEIEAIFIGSAKVFVEIMTENTIEKSSQRMQINVKQKHIVNGVFVKVFNACVIVFYFIMQVHFGVVLDLKKVKSIVQKPLRPFAAFVCNYTLIPLVSWSHKSIFDNNFKQ